MKILMVTSEMTPLARTGNLGDNVSALARSLQQLGHQVAVALPYYRSIREQQSEKPQCSKLKFVVPLGESQLFCEIFETTVDSLQIFLVSHDEFFDRGELYGGNGRDYQDNSSRFIYFSKCALELARRTTPEIVHVHGWQTALLPVFAKEARLPCVTVFTPHTLEFQGNFWSYDFSLTNLSGEYFAPSGLEYYGSINCLKAGILFSDAIVLPTQRYVTAAQTPDYGCGLENVLQEHHYKLEGIPSGVTNNSLRDYSNLEQTKKRTRERLQKKFALAAGGSLFVAHTSATHQAGIQILLGAVDRLPSDDIRILLLGPINEDDRSALEIALMRHPRKFAYALGDIKSLLDESLLGANFFVLPDAFEPTAELLLRSLQNGAIPIAAYCNGLWQFVQDFDPVTTAGNGFTFYPKTTSALIDTFRRVLKIAPEALTRLAEASIKSNFPWIASAGQHVSLYERLLGRNKHP